MKTIINIETNAVVSFNESDLPMLVHGKDRSGASLMSITIAAQLHSQGAKLCIFTAYQMAKEEFLSQIENSPETVFYLETEKDFAAANTYQTVIIQSGNIALALKFIESLTNNQRILFFKNIETMEVDFFEKIINFKFVVSGDLEKNPTQSSFKTAPYNTTILLSELSGYTSPSLEKYQGYIKGVSQEGIIAIKQ